MTGGWRIALLQVVCVIIGCLIWYPFFRLADKQAYKLELETPEEEPAAESGSTVNE